MLKEKLKHNTNHVGVAPLGDPHFEGIAKKQKGITLIALIITIIVMLILVGVSVTVALNGGLFTTAKNAVDRTGTEKDREIGLSEGQIEIGGKIYNSYQDYLDKKPVQVLTAPEELKKYILGADGKGREVYEIVGEGGFTQDPEDANSTIHEKIKLAYIEYDEEDKEFWNIRYNREVYRIDFKDTSDINSEYYGQLITAEDGLVKVSTPEGNLGKYVEYAGNTWIVLREDSNGVELISANTTENEITLGGSDYETARISYNNAVETLIGESKKVCKDEYGIEVGGDVLSIRSVGVPAVDETKNTDTVDFTKLTEFKPQSGFPYANFAGTTEEKGLKIADDKYLNDYNQMKKIGILSSDNYYDYWLASRFVDEYSSGVDFGVRYVNGSGVLDDNGLCYVSYIGRSGCNSPAYAVRPVVTLKSGILNGATGEGTESSPFVIN